MNLLGNEGPQLVILAKIVCQHDGVEIKTTSQLSNCTNAPKFDPDDTMLVKIDDKDCLDELVAFLVVTDYVPYGMLVSSIDCVVE